MARTDGPSTSVPVRPYPDERDEPRGTGRIVIVPGLAVRSYASDAADAVSDAGYDVSLLRAPAWRGAPTDLEAYGRLLAADLDRRDEQVDVLVGLSVGSQAAAVAAASTARVRRLLLVSPTVDPQLRTLPRLIEVWWRGNQGHGEPGFLEQVPDWSRAGLPRILAGFASTLRAQPLEHVLPRVSADITVIHTEHDDLGTAAWAEQLATLSRGRYLWRPNAPHSWPVADGAGFVSVIDRLLAASDGES